MEYLGWKLFRKEALGGGDKYLVALLGAFLTWKSLLGLVFFSSLQGAVVGMVLLALTGRAGPRPDDEEPVSQPATPDAQAVQAGPPDAQAVQPASSSVEAQATPAVPGEAGPAPGASDAQPPSEESEEEEPELTMTWDFTKPGLPVWKRLLRVPYSLLFQPIPDAPLDEEGEEVEWVPGETNIPFGPWLALAGLEILLLGPWLASVLPPEMALLLGAAR
jgi:leader peptidase (prepilin peptidase)/N-methyltransferase